MVAELLYSTCAGAFFAACAYAQHNDPDAAPWIALYLLAGTATAWLLPWAQPPLPPQAVSVQLGSSSVVITGRRKLAHHRNHSRDSSSTAPTAVTAVVEQVTWWTAAAPAQDSSARQLLRRRLRVLSLLSLALCAVLSLVLTALVLRRLDLHAPPQQLLWQFLEDERGREVGGLALLVLHLIYVRRCLRPSGGPAALSAAQQRRTTAVGVDQRMGAAVLLAVLAVAVYAWIRYQPQMQARYNTPHCTGAFAAIGGSSSDNVNSTSSSSSSDLR